MEMPTRTIADLAATDADLDLEASGGAPVEDDAADTDLPLPGDDDADHDLEASGDAPVEDDAADTDLPLPGASALGCDEFRMNELSFNGVDAATGEYQNPPMSTAQLARLVRGERPERAPPRTRDRPGGRPAGSRVERLGRGLHPRCRSRGAGSVGAPPIPPPLPGGGPGGALLPGVQRP